MAVDKDNESRETMHPTPARRRPRRFSLHAATHFTVLPLLATLLLSGCTDTPLRAHPLFTPEQIAERCLAWLHNRDGLVSLDALQPKQWGDYVTCRIATTVLTRYIPPAIGSDPEAIVSVSFLPTGAVESAGVIGSSGEPAWNTEVELALHESEPLPPMPVAARVRRMRLPIRYTRQANPVPALQGESHWSVHDCVALGAGAKSCS